MAIDWRGGKNVYLVPSLFTSHIDGTLTDNTTLYESGPGSNGNEGVLHTHKISRIVALPADSVLWNMQDTSFWGMGVLLFCGE